MIGIAIALIVTLGLGGTAALADNAKPGDALFGIDQSVENIRMSLTAKEKKDELRIRFAEERVNEIEDLSDDSVEEASNASVEISDTTVTEIEADIFTNETLVKIEHSDNKTIVTLEAKTKEGVIDALAAKYPALTKAFIEKTISIETEGRSSRAEDKKEKSELSEEDRANVNIGIEAALNLLAGLNTTPEDSAKVDAITARLNSYLTDLPSNAEINVSDEKFKIEYESDDGDDSGKVEIKQQTKNDRSKTEIRTEDGRIKIEVKNGELEIKTKLENEDEDDNDDDDSSSDSSNDGLEEVEAKVFSDKTVVEVEYNDEKTTFTTSAKTKDAIIAEILSRFPDTTSTQVSAVIKVEIEDADEEEGNDDRDEENKEDDDSSNSGSGKNR